MSDERIVSIVVDGKDKTHQISDWTIEWNDKRRHVQLTCHFPSGRRYSCSLGKCCVRPTREVGEMLLKKHNSVIARPVEKAIIYGERYAVVHYSSSAKPVVHSVQEIKLMSKTAMKDTPAFRYFEEVANTRLERASSDPKRNLAANVVRQLEKLTSCADTALNAYCSGQNGTQPTGKELIFPFGVNESQLAAVEQAFSAQISLIEGPPGTGKTQTILNVLANILLRGKTVAVLSNNNAAIENVYEKLEKAGLDHVVAKLGSQENREKFFANLPSWPATKPEPAPSLPDIQEVLAELKQHLWNHNQAAKLQTEIDELRIQRSKVQQWRTDNGLPLSIDLDRYSLSSDKTVQLVNYLDYLGEQPLRLRDRVTLLFTFGIFRTRPVARNDDRRSFYYDLQLHFYNRALEEKETVLHTCRESLQRGNFSDLMQKLTDGSMRYLLHHLYKKGHASEQFDANNYKNNFDAFMQRFPILGSSTHSIVNSIAPDTILDYVIVDEASQQDIVPGILALGCAKNMIVVGDSKQLSHIPEVVDLPAPDDFYDCEKHSLLNSCIGVFKSALPRTLLKEHYRCHPRIIQFCNQQFYNNALIPMTQDNGEEALRLVVTAKGNHTREKTNLRELDSYLKVHADDGQPVAVIKNGQGFIAPFRAQVELSETCLPADFIKDTLHKFQGRECDEIVFSTVLDEKWGSRRRLKFVDDPCMVNVAVSRAKNRFTLVTGENVFTAINSHVGALRRYIEYYAPDDQIIRSPVVSAFDLLYRKSDPSLYPLEARLNYKDSSYKSEQIVACLLRDVLLNERYQALYFQREKWLDQVALLTNPALTQAERKFMRDGSRCDFVLYENTGGKRPLGVIEVDGGSHDTPDQKRRDALKDSILEKCAVPILRLRTVEAYIEQKIEKFLAHRVVKSAENKDKATHANMLEESAEEVDMDSKAAEFDVEATRRLQSVKSGKKTLKWNDVRRSVRAKFRGANGER